VTKGDTKEEIAVLAVVAIAIASAVVASASTL